MMSNITRLFNAPPQPTHADFEAFWAVYPRRKEKLEALRRWRDAIKIATPAEIIEGAIRYAKIAQEPYIKLPATWLHKGCWMDEDSEPAAPITDAREARLHMMASMVKKAATSKFAADWMKNNVTEQDMQEMKRRGMIPA